MSFFKNQSLLRSKLSSRLFTHIFLSYSFVTLFLTIFQVGIAFQQAQQSISQELFHLAESFKKPLAVALWEINGRQITSTGEAINTQYIVSGVTIFDDQNEIVYQSQRKDTLEIVWFLKPLSHEFKVTRQEQYLGEVKLYSDPLVVWERVQVNLLVFGLNSIIKMLTLSFLFFWVIRHSLAKPLFQLIHQIHELSFLENVPEVSTTPEFTVDLNENTNELKLLESHILFLEKRLGYAKFQWNDLNSHLESEIKERTQDLSETLESLKNTQKQLIEKEKMASLGVLVGGVAHEVNTPVGIAVTAASHLKDSVEQTMALLLKKELRQSQLEDFFENAQLSSDLISRNLKRTAELIQSFKQVSVDQTHYTRKNFALIPYIQDVLQSLSPELKKIKLEMKYSGDETISLDSFPGVIAQITSNLVLNSIKHGFENRSEGCISFEVSLREGNIRLRYSDDGNGADESVVQHIFDPFFTTKVNQGGSGLGMNIVYNLVYQKLQGKITCESSLGKGMSFTLFFPQVCPEK